MADEGEFCTSGVAQRTHVLKTPNVGAKLAPAVGRVGPGWQNIQSTARLGLRGPPLVLNLSDGLGSTFCTPRAVLCDVLLKHTVHASLPTLAGTAEVG